MSSLDDLPHILQGVVADSKDIDTDHISKACRYCATEPDSSKIIDTADDETLKNLCVNLLEVSLEGRADVDEKEVDERRARLALRLLINAANRSERLKASLPVSSLSLWRVLVRLPELRTEVFAALLAFATHMHNTCALEADYATLLGELALLWEGAADGDRSWLSALFSLHLEHDYAFLAHCFGDFAPEQFTAVLNVTETLLDNSETDSLIKVHPNNVEMCVSLVERVLFDFGEANGGGEKRAEYTKQLLFLLEIIASAALRHDEFGSVLLGKTCAVEMAVDVLDAVVDSEYAELIDQFTANPPQPRAADRPAPVMPTRRQRVLADGRLLSLSCELRTVHKDLLASIKCAAVRAIGNLCAGCPSNGRAAGARDGVLLVLSCANRGPTDKPFIAQWAIAAMRHLMSCEENKDAVVGLDERPCGVLDRHRLWRELGIEVELDEAGAVRVKRKRTE